MMDSNLIPNTHVLCFVIDLCFLLQTAVIASTTLLSPTHVSSNIVACYLSLLDFRNTCSHHLYKSCTSFTALRIFIQNSGEFIRSMEYAEVWYLVHIRLGRLTFSSK